MTETSVVREEYFPQVFLMRLVDVTIGIIEILLVFRLGLKFFAANPSTEFVAWIYQLSGSLLGPFAGAFPNMSLGGGSVLDVVAVLAMIVYAVFGWIVIRVLQFIFSSTKT
jgi:uncharacterized protein YggT (Ycf19 family)